jgi:hypothetical protein
MIGPTRQPTGNQAPSAILIRPGGDSFAVCLAGNSGGPIWVDATGAQKKLASQK